MLKSCYFSVLYIWEFNKCTNCTNRKKIMIIRWELADLMLRMWFYYFHAYLMCPNVHIKLQLILLIFKEKNTATRWDPYDSYLHDSDLFILSELLNLWNCKQFWQTSSKYKGSISRPNLPTPLLCFRSRTEPKKKRDGSAEIPKF